MGRSIMKGTQIQAISAEGLRYLDENGVEQFIDFSVCFENYVKWSIEPSQLEEVKKLNRMDDRQLEKYIEELREWKQVAYRGEDGFPWATQPCEGSCIEFHTIPPTRFEFETEDELFYEVYVKIRRLGWQTLDLS